MKKESKGFWATWCPIEETLLCRRWLATLTLSKRPREYCTTLLKKEAELPGALSAVAEMVFARPLPSLAMASCRGPLVSCKNVGEIQFTFKLKCLRNTLFFPTCEAICAEHVELGRQFSQISHN